MLQIVWSRVSGEFQRRATQPPIAQPLAFWEFRRPEIPPRHTQPSFRRPNDDILALGQQMDRFERLRDRDNEIHEAFVEFFPWTVELLGRTTAPSKTVRVFLWFIAKTNFLKEGIFDLCESDNIYGANVLYRSLIEYYLRFMYVWFRFLKEHTDEAAHEYLTFCAWDEALKYGKSLQDVERIMGRVPLEDPYDTIRRIHPEAAQYSAREIRARAKQFSFPKIMKFLATEWLAGDALKKAPPDFLLNLIPLYSELCSFVHGGPDADSEVTALGDPTKRANENVRVAEQSWRLAGSVKLFSLIVLYQSDKKFGPPYLRIECILKAGLD